MKPKMVNKMVLNKIIMTLVIELFTILAWFNKLAKSRRILLKGILLCMRLGFYVFKVV